MRLFGRKTGELAFVGLDVDREVVGLDWLRVEHLSVVMRYVQQLLGRHLGGVELTRLALIDPQVEPSELIADCEVPAFADRLRELLTIGYLNWAELQVPEHGLAVPVRFEGSNRMGSIVLHLEGVDPQLAESIAVEVATQSGVELNFRGRRMRDLSG